MALVVLSGASQYAKRYAVENGSFRELVSSGGAAVAREGVVYVVTVGFDARRARECIRELVLNPRSPFQDHHV